MICSSLSLCSRFFCAYFTPLEKGTEINNELITPTNPDEIECAEAYLLLSLSFAGSAMIVTGLNKQQMTAEIAACTKTSWLIKSSILSKTPLVRNLS